MKDIFPQIQSWAETGNRFALATVVHTWGSAPRQVGAALAVSEEGEMIGSVSGGCVEGAVVKEALSILEENRPRVLKFGVTDEEAWTVGLTCGGTIHLLVEPFLAFNREEQDIWRRLSQTVSDNQSCVLATAMAGEKPEHALVFPDGETLGMAPDPALVEAALKAFRARKNQVFEGERGEYFIQVFPRKSQLLIVGAAHITADLVRLGNLYDFETIVIDPRGFFAHQTQFPEPPHQLMNDWPAEVLPGFILDEYAYAVLLSHDPKIDDQALQILLNSGIGYIGALGSGRTHEKRVRRLRDAGFSEEQIARIHGPVGVNINAKSAKEIALSILAQIVMVQNGGG
jgi:xanthine dehydrogenase accessory factor